MLAEGVEVELVRAPHHHAVELHVLLRERDLARLDRELQVLEGVERALEQIAELEEPSGGFDELPLRLVQRDRLKRRGERFSERSAVTWRSPASTLICGPIVTAPTR